MVRAQFATAGGLPASEAVGKSTLLPGLVVPHLDFRVSSDVYAHGYRALLEAEAPEVVVILGVGHRSRVELSADGRDYETVLGRAVVDQPLLAALREKSPVPGAVVSGPAAAHVCAGAVRRDV
jgi:AmmeMemoRadiSam system protein B